MTPLEAFGRSGCLSGKWRPQFRHPKQEGLAHISQGSRGVMMYTVKVHEKTYKYSSDLKDVARPGASFSLLCNTSKNDNRTCIHICLNTVIRVPSASDGL